MDEVAIIIPARLQSSRLPGKLLLECAGKSVLQRTWETACRVKRAQRVIIATEDHEIRQAAVAFGADVVMTARCRSGSERVAEVGERLRESMVVNVQGDEPELDPEHVELLIAQATRQDWVPIWTLAAPLPAEDAINPDRVKIARQGERALYFSRAPLAGADLHVGVYLFRRDYLSSIRRAEPGALSRAERLEQIAWLEAGYRIGATGVPVAHGGIDSATDLDHFRTRLAS